MPNVLIKIAYLKKLKILNQLIKTEKIMVTIKVQINGKVVIKSDNNEDRFII